MTNFDSFEAFWPFYLKQHSKRLNRILHGTGTLLALICMMTALVTKSWIYVFMAPVLGYGFAWIGHFFIEKNQPATFTYPLWSFWADFKMFQLMITGRLDDEISRHLTNQ